MVRLAQNRTRPRPRHRGIHGHHRPAPRRPRQQRRQSLHHGLGRAHVRRRQLQRHRPHVHPRRGSRPILQKHQGRVHESRPRRRRERIRRILQRHVRQGQLHPPPEVRHLRRPLPHVRQKTHHLLRRRPRPHRRPLRHTLPRPLAHPRQGAPRHRLPPVLLRGRRVFGRPPPALARHPLPHRGHRRIRRLLQLRGPLEAPMRGQVGPKPLFPHR
mmetsp:Transcript_11622/g.30710  ORF Transcript_11622/g.30710 Transcript_11622/m.30710 type:complete len:214 (-) Transcript_11622:1346-1987(-)